MVDMDRLNRLIKEKGITKSFLGDKMGLYRGKLNEWDRGKSTPKPHEISFLCDFFGVTEDYLAGRSDRRIDYIKTEELVRQAGGMALSSLKPVPVLGVIRASVPIYAAEQVDGYEFADVGSPDDYFYLRVRGDSMIGANITDGSLVLVRKQSTAENGQIVACIVDGENATLKRFKQDKGIIALIPENSSYNPILLTRKDFEENNARILGVAVEVKIRL